MFAKLENNVGWFLETEEECRNWIMEMVDELPLKRAEIEDIDPNEKGSAQKAQHLSQAFLMAVGSTQGTIAALQRTRKIPTAMADELHMRCLGMLLAKVEDVPLNIGVEG